ncbi:hypothetical protein [Fructobacillus tropaeoli]|uniref:hypothetical protein n=1 Tax=Fructobacillus tropaeoli TaxID=709323 RepID=UPI002DB00F44|nr:hypothetical protein LMG30238_FMBOGHMB_01558 [Fructobacillus tropaeoli]
MTNRQEKRKALQKMMREIDVYNWEHPASTLRQVHEPKNRESLFQLALILRNNYQVSCYEIAPIIDVPVSTIKRELNSRSQKYETLQDLLHVLRKRQEV